jgi:hypothetical protein
LVLYISCGWGYDFSIYNKNIKIQAIWAVKMWLEDISKSTYREAIVNKGYGNSCKKNGSSLIKRMNLTNR